MNIGGLFNQKILTVILIMLFTGLVSCKDDDDEGFQVSHISPISGAPGTLVIIYGNQFSSIISENRVTFNGVESTVTSATATQLLVTVPVEATTGLVVATVQGKTAREQPFFIVGESLLAKLETSEAKDIGYTTALLSGEVKSEGQSAVTLRGFCWSENHMPTVNDNVSENKFGPGPMTHAVNKLKAGVTYFARTYATNGQGTVYGNEISFSTKAFAIGDTGIADGFVFYDKGSYSDGWRYLEAAPSEPDFYPTSWGCEVTNIVGTLSSVGSGAANTVLITSSCTYSVSGIAAQKCSNLILNGYDDWFLPSLDELKLMYENLSEKGLGNFSGYYYWSSTQNNASQAFGLYFLTGAYYPTPKNNIGAGLRPVHAI